MNWNVALVAALILHQLNVVARDGLPVLRHRFAPITGVSLPEVFVYSVQVAALPVAAILLIPEFAVLTLAAIGVTLVWASVQNWRLSNHVALAITTLPLTAFVGSTEAAWRAEMVLALLYLSSAIFKFNHEFVYSPNSCAREVLRIFAERNRFVVPKAVSALTPVVVLAVELILGFGLLVDGDLIVLFAIAAVLHLVLGVTGNFVFSFTAICVWGMALRPTLAMNGVDTWLICFVVVAAAITGYRLNTSWVYSYRRLGDALVVCMPALFCGVTVVMGGTAMAGSETPTLGVVVAVVAISVNVGSVVLGYRTEAAFAMFSNIRPLGSSRVLFWRPRWRARYFRLTMPPAIPEALLAEIPLKVLGQALLEDNVVYEPLAASLERHANAHGASFAPRPVEFDSTLGTIRPNAADTSLPRPGPLLFPPLLSTDPNVPAMR